MTNYWPCMHIATHYEWNNSKEGRFPLWLPWFLFELECIVVIISTQVIWLKRRFTHYKDRSSSLWNLFKKFKFIIFQADMIFNLMKIINFGIIYATICSWFRYHLTELKKYNKEIKQNKIFSTLLWLIFIEITRGPYHQWNLPMMASISSATSVISNSEST